MTDQRFPREVRLLTSADFSRVMSGAQYKIGHTGFLLLASPASGTNARLGFIIARKHVKHAVDRNRIKRCLRETFRKTHQSFPALDIVFLARHDASKLLAEDIHAAASQAFDRLCRKAKRP